MDKKSAVVVESSDDGGQNWMVHGIYWNSWEAAVKAREIPWQWRLRRVDVSDGDLISDQEIDRALSEVEDIVVKIYKTEEFFD